MPNFADIASKKIGEIERPPLPPQGDYQFQVTKLPSLDKSNDGKWEILTINCRAVAPIDVEAADLEDYKGEVTGITQQVKFMFNTESEADFDRTLFRARQFFENHAQCAGEKDSLQEAINSSVGSNFMGHIAWTQDKNDPEVFWANIDKTAPLA